MSRFAGLPAALKATKDAAKGKPEEIEEPETPENDDEDEQSPPSKGKDTDMPEGDQNAAVETAKKEADAAGFKRASDRFAAVMASEHYEGREAFAGKLLTKEALASASADDIIDLLADGPKVDRSAAAPEALQEAREEGERAGMKEALKGGENSKINANDDGGKPDARAKSDSVWEKARAHVDKKEVK